MSSNESFGLLTHLPPPRAFQAPSFYSCKRAVAHPQARERSVCLKRVLGVQLQRAVRAAVYGVARPRAAVGSPRGAAPIPGAAAIAGGAARAGRLVALR